MSEIASLPHIVAEIQGLYGPVSVPEILVQKLWRRGDFVQEGLHTLDGQPLRVIQPGQWNRQGGPDFLGAELELDGQTRVGDVEIHFYQRNWYDHGHDRNPAFANVILHVVVFDPREGERPACYDTGAPIPTLLLAPFFPEDLEAYAVKDAWMALENRDMLDLVAPLLELPVVERRARLRLQARRRWQQKMRFARYRLQLAGAWPTVVHQYTLEMLGLRRNRGPMSGLAERFPLQEMEAMVARDGVEATADRLIAVEEGNWTLAGMRPANHPRARLRQYLSLLAARPAWPHRLRDWLASQQWEHLPEANTQAYRRQCRLGAHLRELEKDVLAGTIGGSRFATLCVDAFWPLAAAEFDAEELWWLPWFHSPAGDLPDALDDYLRLSAVQDRQWPACNGWGQGALERLLTRELQPWRAITA
ncbi:MAG: DUF2851 family protein [Verrucomicrobiota bacterium JB022]|nr:DUF2851 family protein [Verrucomicrobiota bacterium JB022]